MPWMTDELPELVSSKGACSILNVQKATLARWQRPQSGTKESSHGPESTYMLRSQRVGDPPGDFPIWAKADVEKFAHEIGRQRSSPRKAQAAKASLRPTTTVLLENHAEIAVANTQDEVRAAITEARRTGSMVVLTVVFESRGIETSVHPDAIRVIAPITDTPLYDPAPAGRTS